MRSPSRNNRRKTIALVALSAVVLGGLIASNGLVSCASSAVKAPTATRPVTDAEAQRLAAVRFEDYRTGHVGVHVTIGSGTDAVHLSGWVDWRQPLIYLNSVGTGPGAADGLLQAVPGVVATRPGRYIPPSTGAPVDPFPSPPVIAPPTGWQIHPVRDGSAIGTMVALLFALRSGTVDDADQIASIGTRYVGTDEIGGATVDILDGAALPPPKPDTTPKPGTTPKPSATPKPGVTSRLSTPPRPSAASGPAATPRPGTASPVTPSPSPSPSPTGAPFAAQGGQVRYWVDARSRLLRAEALVNPTTALRIDFDRTDATVPTAIELLGGAPNTPTRPTPGQATQLSGMRLRDRVSGGGTITVAIPVTQDELISATGFLDWRHTALYLVVRNNTGTAADALLRADATGVTTRASTSATASTPAGGPSPPATPPPRTSLATPPLRPPATGWHRQTWASRLDRYGQPDFDLLLTELLALSAPATDNAAAIRAVSARLRGDTINGVPVTVYEIRKPAEAYVAPGYGRLRYWVDANGLLRRLELRTRNGAYGYVTITPGHVPVLPDPVPVPAP